MATDDFDLKQLLANRPRMTTASGLEVIFYGEPEPDADSPIWNLSSGGLALPSRPAPSMLQQIVVTPQKSDLGLDATTEAELRELLRPLNVGPALVWTSRHLIRLWNLDDSDDDQIALAQEIFDPDAPIIAAFRRFLTSSTHGERRVLFSEQQFHVLLRLALESCSGPHEDTSWDRTKESVMRKALIGVTSITDAGTAGLQAAATTLTDWLGFFTQNGAYNSKEEPLLAYQRVFSVFVDLATSDQARAHPSFVSLENLSQKHFGASVEELLTVGFAASASALETQDGEPTSFGIVPRLAKFLEPTVLADRADHFAKLLSADKKFYVEGFARSRDDPARLAWDLTPVLQRPFFSLPGDGPLLLLSPRAMASWLTDGAYYRLLDAAAKDGARDAFTTFVGFLYEIYLVEVFRAALPDRDSGSGRVHGEVPYGGAMTSDIALDFGQDLVLIEIASTRLPLGVRAEGNEEELHRFLGRAVYSKVAQLSRVVDDLISEKVAIPDVLFSSVDRVWPVLVNVGELTEGEGLSEAIDGAGDYLHQPQCQPLTLLGIDDAETLAGIAGGGGDLVGTLAAKIADGYGALSLHRWIEDKLPERPPRLAELEARWDRISKRMIDVLQLRPPSP